MGYKFTFSSFAALGFCSERKMIMSRLTFRTVFHILLILICVTIASSTVEAQRRRVTAGGGSGRAVVVDERLSVLRNEPSLSGQLVQRLGRGRMVSIIGTRRTSEGIMYHRVAVTRRTRGWVQAESLVSPGRAGDDERLLRLIRGSEGFDRIARAQIFLDTFPRSPLRPAVLLIHGEALEAAATTLSRDASRRLDAQEMAAGSAPVHTYFANFNALDRYNRLGIRFLYDRAERRFRYDGASWREIVRRYPNSPEASEAQRRLLAARSNVNPQ
jgi:hypothetical protein